MATRADEKLQSLRQQPELKTLYAISYVILSIGKYFSSTGRQNRIESVVLWCLLELTVSLEICLSMVYILREVLEW